MTTKEPPENHANYNAVIPAPVRHDKDLSAQAKLLYAEISARCCTYGYSWAGNRHYATIFDVSNRTIRRWIEQLADAGHIIVQVDPDQGNLRFIWLAEAYRLEPAREGGADKNVPTPPDKSVRTPTDKNVLTPPDKNVRYNNIKGLYNTSNEISESNARAREDDSQQTTEGFHILDPPELEEAFARWKRHLREQGKHMGLTAEEALRATFAAHPDPPRLIAAVEHSIQNVYKSIVEPTKEDPDHVRSKKDKPSDEPRGKLSGVPTQAEGGVDVDLDEF